MRIYHTAKLLFSSPKQYQQQDQNHSFQRKHRDTTIRQHFRRIFFFLRTYSETLLLVAFLPNSLPTYSETVLLAHAYTLPRNIKERGGKIRSAQEHRDALRLCYALGDAVATCLGLDSAPPVVEDAAPGPAVLSAWWVSDAGAGDALSERTSASSVIFEVTERSAILVSSDKCCIYLRDRHTSSSRFTERRSLIQSTHRLPFQNEGSQTDLHDEANGVEIAQSWCIYARSTSFVSSV